MRDAGNAASRICRAAHEDDARSVTALYVWSIDAMATTDMADEETISRLIPVPVWRAYRLNATYSLKETGAQ